MPTIVFEHPILTIFELFLLSTVVAHLGLELWGWWQRRGSGLKMGRKPGDKTWGDLSLAWLVAMAYAGPLVGMSDLPARCATLLHTFNVLAVTYVALISRPGRRHVIQLTNRVKNVQALD